MFAIARSLMAGARRELHQSVCRCQASETTAKTSQIQSTDRQKVSNSSDSDELSTNIRYTHYTTDDFKELIKNENDRSRVHLILLERDSLLGITNRVPPLVSAKNMTRLMQLPSKISRQNYFNYMFSRQMSEMKAKIKKEQRRAAYEARPKKVTYFKTDILVGVREQTIRRFYNWRLASAVTFSQKLVLDCAFEDLMTPKELSSFGQQLQFMYNYNKIARDPFELILSDVPRGGKMDELISRYIPQIGTNSCLLTRSYERFHEMFPDKRIVYLSPNSNHTLKKWDPDAVFVIGGIVDTSGSKQVTLGRAKELGVHHAKLPLGVYIPQFSVNTSKALTIPAVTNILLTMRETNDWEQAMKHVPRRLIYNIEKLSPPPKRYVVARNERGNGRPRTARNSPYSRTHEKYNDR